MIYKVLYQENADTPPIREHTKSLYLEAESVRDAYKKLENRTINIELIQLLDEAHLEYEMKSKYYKLENV